MAHVDPSPYAVSKICFPTLALSKPSCSPSTSRTPFRKASSENHRDYLNQLHQRKAASLKEKKAKAERIRLENEASWSPHSNTSSFDLGTLSTSSSFIHLPSNSPDDVTYSQIVEYSVPFVTSPTPPSTSHEALLVNNNKETVNRNFDLLVGRRGRRFIRSFPATVGFCIVYCVCYMRWFCCCSNVQRRVKFCALNVFFLRLSFAKSENILFRYRRSQNKAQVQSIMR